MTNSLRPSLNVLVKLGSIAVHAKEMTSPDGHAFDKIALDTLLKDPDIVTWLAEMDQNSFLPKMRKP
jgi:hypothetical protein